MAAIRRTGVSRFTTTTAMLVVLAGCSGELNNLDFDLRDLGDGFDTSDAVSNLPDRPAPDNRGIISYPNYQVVLAQTGDTATSIATRLGLDVATLARFNGVEPDAVLRRDEVLALPTRVAEPSPATGAIGTGPIQPFDVASVATTALDRVDAQAATTGTTAPAPQSGAEPVRYQVGRGDTAFSIARQFNVPVSSIAAWNTLDANLSVREGQFLLIPQGGVPAPTADQAPVSDPGVGSATPLPPSSATPLPAVDPSIPAPPEATPAAPDLGAGTPPAPESPAAAATPAAPTGDTATLVRPVSGGSIIRAYAAGRNEGIDIGVPAGTDVKAADAGTVAAVTTDTSGVAIVVIKHADNLLTVYTNLADLSVDKNATVSRGQTIAKVGPGNPSFVHFEVRRGLDSLDPAEFLP